MNRPLRLEPLEARDVPAIVLAGLAGGILTITEAPGAANDVITLTQSGDRVTITSTDGIYVDDRYAGTSVDIPAPNRIDVLLLEGGDDDVSDDTDVGVRIDAGPGNDRVGSTGGRFNPLLLPLVLSGTFDPALLPLVSEEVAKKRLAGGSGDDVISGPVLGFFSFLDGGDGNDVVFAGLGPDVVSGGAGRDALLGGPGDLFLAADGEPDFVFALAAVVQSDPLDRVPRF